jgi:hypothetical protein
VPIGWPYCRTYAPAAIACVANRFPGVTGSRIVTMRSASAIWSPTGMPVFATATLSAEFTAIAKSRSGAGDSVSIRSMVGPTESKNQA